VWSFCEKIAPGDSHNLADFYQAPLLWPQSDSNWQYAESDFAEGALNSGDLWAHAHYGGSGAQDHFDVKSVEPTFDPTQWHVYTQEWGPGFRSYYVDGKLIGTSTNQVWSGLERWQIQIEPSGLNDGDSGHVYVNWVWIGTPAGSAGSGGSPPPPSAPANTAPPSITGTPQQGSTLTASTGSWSNNPTGYGYHWQDCAATQCTDISGATSSTYTPQAGDVGSKIDVVVTATGAGGSSSATSAQVGPVTSASSGGTATIQHVVWVVMENHAYGQIIGSSQAPYINSLASTYGVATNYYAISHPSLPNYIALTSGSPQGIADDNGPSSHPLNVASIFSQLPAGQSRSLEESMPSNCDRGDSGQYAVRHDPEAYYTNLGSDCLTYDVPFGSTPDLSAKFTFVTPNVCDDMHDCSVQTGDTFLSSYVPRLLATTQYQAGNTVIFITWDEDDGSSNNHVPTIVISPYTHAVQDSTSYTHYSLLKTTEQLFGLAQIGNATSANSMLGKFGF
jgi:hypothetical protein